MNTLLDSEPSTKIERFGLSRERGFLPEPDPLTQLPADFEPWEEIAGDLPKLLLSGRLRGLIDALPDLPTDWLDSEPALRRAMLLLSYFGHAYMWSGEPVKRLPRALAVPWYEVASRLGRPPVLSYASYALDNWRRIDGAGPVELGNIIILQNFLGGADEDWFIAVHVDIEFKAAVALRAVAPALVAAAQDDAAALNVHLTEMANCIERLAGVLERMPEYCDPYIYYRRVRPYIHGWKDHPALPDGVVYEGVEVYRGAPQKFRGETGAQSGIVPTLDAALGLVHANDRLRDYLMEMRGYMPPAHRKFLEAVEAAQSLRNFVEGAAKSHPDLAEAYNACLHWLETFRSIHLKFANAYIYAQSQANSGNPTEIGTGGTPFMPYLKKHRDECREQHIKMR